MTEDECIKGLQQVRLEYRNLKKQAVQLHERWLEDLAEAMTKDGNTTQATQLEQLK